MRVLSAASELKPGSRKVCVAIGVFDGVHLGHQQVIRPGVSEIAPTRLADRGAGGGDDVGVLDLLAHGVLRNL